jgi:hypothetical protein
MRVMKPHKDDQSTPAGVPHLQEVGHTVTYEDVLVTTKYLQQLRSEVKNADAQSFIETHNRICGLMIFNKKGV